MLEKVDVAVKSSISMGEETAKGNNMPSSAQRATEIKPSYTALSPPLFCPLQCQDIEPFSARFKAYIKFFILY
jgi:hypothetical protein